MLMKVTSNCYIPIIRVRSTESTTGAGHHHNTRSDAVMPPYGTSNISSKLMTKTSGNEWKEAKEPR
jgi:hypothetical protein